MFMCIYIYIYICICGGTVRIASVRPAEEAARNTDASAAHHVVCYSMLYHIIYKVSYAMYV